jgi:hypothetical protein
MVSVRRRACHGCGSWSGPDRWLPGGTNPLVAWGDEHPEQKRWGDESPAGSSRRTDIPPVSFHDRVRIVHPGNQIGNLVKVSAALQHWTGATCVDFPS